MTVEQYACYQFFIIITRAVDTAVSMVGQRLSLLLASLFDLLDIWTTHLIANACTNHQRPDEEKECARLNSPEKKRWTSQNKTEQPPNLLHIFFIT